MVRKGEFVDDVVLLASTREAAETATRIDVARAFGLTVSLQKTKFMVVGREMTKEDKMTTSCIRERLSG